MSIICMRLCRFILSNTLSSNINYTTIQAYPISTLYNMQHAYIFLAIS